jgi:cytochrome c oxidase cbb3-type subunit I/II
MAANGELCNKPYTALELTGRDLYVREGCYLCHSQMIRPFRSEQMRYGDPSRIEESQWDHPFQWGSKRTGPDLAREGSRQNESWHWNHMRRPRDVVTESIMPNFGWLYAIAADKMKVLKKLGVPYTDAQLATAGADYDQQAQAIVSALAEQGIKDAVADREIVAMIAYLRRLGRNLLPAGKVQVASEGGK